MHPSLLDRLTAVVGATNVLTGADAAAYMVDPRGAPGGEPVAVVRPGSTAEVAAVVTACAQTATPVVAQGGHTGMSGGAQVGAGLDAVVVSLRRLDSIERVDPIDRTAMVGAGATIEALQLAAAEAGLRFAPDWGARGSATIGGAVATNAGGNNVVHHGPLRDHVLGLEVVLADGRVWDGLRSLRKDATGYRLRDLFIGSEGTLGLVTRVVVGLVAPSADEVSAVAALRDLDAAPELLDRALRSGTPVTAFELVPERGLTEVVARFHRPRPLATVAEWYALVRVSAPRGCTATDMVADLLAEASRAGLVTDAAVAGTPEQEAALWAIRDELSPSLLFSRADAGAKFDTAVPVGRVAEFVRRASTLVAAIGGAKGWEPYAFGHVGDGNIHFYALAPTGPADPTENDVRAEIERAVDTLVVELDGSLSAEHGIGRLLPTRVRAQKSPLETELAWRIKDAFDPAGILNPGAGLPARDHGIARG